MRCNTLVLRWALTQTCAQGQPFNVLQNYFPDGTPIGLLNVRSGACLYNPDASVIMQPGEVMGLQCTKSQACIGPGLICSVEDLVKFSS